MSDAYKHVASLLIYLWLFSVVSEVSMITQKNLRPYRPQERGHRKTKEDSRCSLLLWKLQKHTSHYNKPLPNSSIQWQKKLTVTSSYLLSAVNYTLFLLSVGCRAHCWFHVVIFLDFSDWIVQKYVALDFDLYVFCKIDHHKNWLKYVLLSWTTVISMIKM